MKHIHILGICGTFMSGIAALAHEQGYRVTGCDKHVYPPMSTQLQTLGIDIIPGFDLEQLKLKPDCFIIGNAMMRGNPLVEAILNQNLVYQSGPEWLAQHILAQRWVLAVAGTHGKTTTTSILIWILQYAGLNPGYLLGGIANNFPRSAQLGETDFFVIEGDEYDSAFFDKRSKFIHYHPHTLILNNLEFDHADIFSDLADIKRQFHHLLRTVPAEGLVIYPAADAHLQSVLDQGCWSMTTTFGTSGEWQLRALQADHQTFEVQHENKSLGLVHWSMLGSHNSHNALAAVIAARHVGVPVATSVAALAEYKGVKRRLEIIGQPQGITVYDDFAHHPTAIKTTLTGLRAKVGSARIIVVLELGSYTMRAGVHGADILTALQTADEYFLAQSKQNITTKKAINAGRTIHTDVAALVTAVANNAQTGDHILIMSNTGFAGFQQLLLQRLMQ